MPRYLFGGMSGSEALQAISHLLTTGLTSGLDSPEVSGFEAAAAATLGIDPSSCIASATGTTALSDGVQSWWTSHPTACMPGPSNTPRP
jgi:hypothetical protein